MVGVTTLTTDPTSATAAGHALRRLVSAHLDVADDLLDDLPSLSAQHPLWRHISVQAALDDLLADQPTSELVGIPMFMGIAPSLGELLMSPGVELGPVDWVNKACGSGETMACINAGLLLCEWGGAPVAIWVRAVHEAIGTSRFLAVEARAASLETVKGVLDDLRGRMTAADPYKGKSLRLVLDQVGDITDIEFSPKPEVDRDELILPPGVLEAVEAHAVGVGRAAARLRAAGRHLKRGLLLYGPPGTGKTHTIRYLTTRLPEATLFVLTGGQMGQVKQISGLLAELAPAIVVLDDVDLVAQDRSEADNAGSVLFNLLDAMDGIREDVDVLFVCTSNRAEVLEAAIAARPGRIDQAVEVGLPDDDCRMRLVELYGHGLDLRLADPQLVIERTDGVTASFVKELLRRATLVALRRGITPGADGRLPVTDAEVHAALDVLLDPDQPLTPALLGIHDPADASRLERAKQRGAGQAWCGI